TKISPRIYTKLPTVLLIIRNPIINLRLLLASALLAVDLLDRCSEPTAGSHDRVEPIVAPVPERRLERD
ncbi:uncharacterized protein A4U43_C09F5670, partial [Asparagus officinalis]